MPTPEWTRFLFIYLFFILFLFYFFLPLKIQLRCLFFFFSGKEGGGENCWREAVRGERRRCWWLEMSS